MNSDRPICVPGDTLKRIDDSGYSVMELVTAISYTPEGWTYWVGNNPRGVSETDLVKWWESPALVIRGEWLKGSDQ